MSKPEKAIIHIDSMYGFKHRQAFVTLKWGDMEGVMTPAEARLHALAIIHQAEVAEQDAFLFEFGRNAIAVDAALATQEERDQVGAKILARFREWRNQRRSEK